MTDEEYEKIAGDWQAAKKAADDFYDQFITSSENGIVVSQALRSITPKDTEKIAELRKVEADLAQKWEAAVRDIAASNTYE